MKKIITAIGNQELNNYLKQEKQFEIKVEDIQYKEGILEYLEEYSDIDYLILSELLPGIIELKQLIEKIKTINSNIQIILFLESKKDELENYLYAKGIYNIFYHNEIEIKDIIELIKNNPKNTEIELKKELSELKKLLLEKENKNKFQLSFYNYSKNNKKQNKNIQENKKQNNLFNNKNKKNSKNILTSTKINSEKEIVCISGTSGVGKSIFTINLAKSLIDYRNKILIIDFDVLNNSLHTILGIKKYSEKIKNKIRKNNLLQELKVEELIMKINSKIDLISGINLLFDSKYKISSTKIKNILSKLKENYDTIIIDTSSECFFDYTKEIMKNSNLNIFITEANLLEIKKAKRLLNIYINEWEIDQKNFNILFNKYDKNSIDFSILKHIFFDFSILGKLSISTKYNLMINRNSINCLDKNLKEEYSKINQNLFSKNLSLNTKNKKNYFLKLKNCLLKKI